MIFARDDKYLLVRSGVVLNSALEESIANTRPYFEKAGLKAEVSSGIRTAEEQLRLIIKCAKEKGLTDLPGFKYGTANKLDSTKTIATPKDLLTEFKWARIFWWQIIWSTLLQKGVIINPAQDAIVLCDYFNKAGVNKRGQKLLQSTHTKGVAWDISGGNNLDEVCKVVEEATKDPKTRIKSFVKEVVNNCCHQTIL